MKRLVTTILCAMVFFAIALTAYFQMISSHSNIVNRVEAGAEHEAQDSATVSFGGWMTTPAVNRFPNASPMTANHHAMAPKTVTIKAGGMVNFVISGFHQIIVYDKGTQPASINTNLRIAPTGPGNIPPI